VSAYQNVGIIGVGNMGSAIIAGITTARDTPSEVIAWDIDPEALEEVCEQYSIESSSSIEDLVNRTDLIVLCVKPGVVPDVLKQISAEGLCLISIAAGITLETLNEHLATDAQLIRVMPNTPAQIGKGMSFITPDPTADDRFVQVARKIFESVGATEIVKEEKMDAVTALSGSGPAYLFYFLEALEEAGVYLGLDLETSRKAAKETVYGAISLARQRSDATPAQLRSEVSSPGGTTVEAVKYFDENGMKGIVEEALKQARDKSETLGN